jgi:hypothetical protein
MKSRPISIPAPIGGLNDRDSIADMPPTDAVVMNNWWPYPSYVGIRKGATNHVTGFSNPVETLVEYLPTSGASKLFAAAGTSIFDVTTPGALGAAVQTGLSNARWQDANITTPGGSFLYLVNGADSPRLWNGTTWTTITGVSTPAITGVTTTDLAHVTVFKNRLYFAVKNSMNVAYLPVLSVGGAASLLDLGSVFRLGGSINAIYTWTLDAGSGSDDHLVIISTNGEVAVYQGTDPSVAANWTLIGVFVLGRPLGRRCAVKYGGDLAVNTTEGVYPLGKGLLSASVDRRIALTDKIQNSVSVEAQSYADSFGWQLCLYPDANMLILNVPSVSKFQYAQNTITGAWAQFTGWAANVWLRASSGLYFGDATTVKKAWSGNLDVTVPIQGDIAPAFSYFGNKAYNKFFTMVSPYLQTSGNPSVLYSLNTDFSLQEPNGTLSFTPPTGMVWGSMTWGSMVWGGGLTPIKSWNTVGAVANSAAIRLRIMNNGSEVRFTNCDYFYQISNGVL